MLQRENHSMKTISFKPFNRGFSLIELMVGIAVSLVLIAIASSIFVGGVRSSRVQEEKAKQTETAHLVMEMLSREIKSAGFYPALIPSNAKPGFVDVDFPNVTTPLITPLSFGVFGCDGAGYDRASGQCLPPTTGNPDTLLINYFSDDSFPQGADTFPGPGSGTRRDCLNGQVDTLPYNATNTRVITGSAVLVTNIYTLSASQTFQANAATPVTTRSFGCWPLNQLNFQPFFLGVEQLRFRYGLLNANNFQAPQRYYTAAEVSALPSVVIGGIQMVPWQRVVSIEVCLLTRSVEYKAGASQSTVLMKDCYDQDMPKATNVLTREVFNARNKSGVTL
jgi:type IV pilus assembly protein PilW